MDTRLSLLWLGAFLSVLVIRAAPVSENFVVFVHSNVTVHTKQAAVLPCWLSPQQSAEEMEVNWFYRDQFDSPVMVYKGKNVNSASQPASYSGRVSFGQKDASSGGLKDGDVTLKMINVTLADAGEYTCYVSSEKHHDRASFNLIVTQTGEPPLLTAVRKENNEVNVSCESNSWHPEPKVQWSAGGSALPPKAVVYSKSSSGLVSVHSWVLVSSSSEVSCSMGLTGQEPIEGRMRLNKPESQTQDGSSVTPWALFALMAAILIAVLGFIFYQKIRGKNSKSKAVSANGECETLLEEVPNRDNYVNVTLVESDNKYILMRNNVLRDAGGHFPDDPNVTCLTAVRGSPGISSGKHYWEVSLAIIEKTDIPIKQSWWIGVTNHSNIPVDHNLASTADNGFWFLSSSPQSERKLKFSSNPPVYFRPRVMPQRVGVLLDYDGGELGFYNVEERSFIGSIATKFSGEVFPLFNPGKGDKAPMKIMHRNDEGTTNGAETPDDKGVTE